MTGAPLRFRARRSVSQVGVALGLDDEDRAGRLADEALGHGAAEPADEAGAGGLIEDISHRKVPMRYAYLLILLVTLGITWETDVNGIIAWASRAFALFYMLQCVVAFLVARHMKDLPRRTARLSLFAALAVVCLLVFALGLPSE